MNTTARRRRTWLRDLLARQEGIELRFVQHRDSGTVHVIVPDDPEVESEIVTPQDDEEKFNVVMGLMRSVNRTICGYTAYVWFCPTVHSDNVVSEFADELLCSKCVLVLGEHSARAFEHPLPPLEDDVHGTQP